MSNTPFWYRAMAALLVVILSLNPIITVAANIAVDQSSGNTTLDQAGNGVPVINIATPNANGLSHNKFTDFNVSQRGLILNNSTERLAKSQLGGYLQNNPNLNGRAARFILNEVTGTNPSQLRGYTEILGQSANYILANPYGITCNGCGFINTPRVTLSTGEPQIGHGKVKSFNVKQGEIAIEGLGLNATNVDKFDIVTRAAKLNAEVHAKQLNIITGRNTVNYRTNQVTKTNTTEDNDEKLEFALDASALGGMYANSIKLIGTEQGVGVRVAGDMAANAGDIVISADGNIQLSRTYATNNIAVNSNDSIELKENTYAKNTVSLKAKNTITNKKILGVAQKIDIEAAHIIQKGQVISGINSEGNEYGEGQLNIKSNRLDNKNETIIAKQSAIDVDHVNNQFGKITSKNSTLKSKSVNNKQGSITAINQLNATVDGLLDNTEGKIQAENTTIKAGSVNNTKGTVATRELAIDTKNSAINRSGTIVSENTTFRSNSLNNTQGLISATNKLDLVVEELVDNTKGKVQAGKVKINSNSLVNAKGEVLTKQLSINTESDLDNREGTIEANDGLAITSGGNIDNRQGIIKSLATSERASVATSGFLNNLSGVIATNSQSLVIKASSINNENGEISHYGSSTSELVTQRINNQSGKLFSKGDIVGLDVAIDNTKGSILANKVSINGNSHIKNTQGEVVGNQLGINIIGNITNSGGLISQLGTSDQVLKADTIINNSIDENQKGRIESNANSLTVQANRLDNQGDIIHVGIGLLDIVIDFLNNVQGNIKTNGSLVVKANTVDNKQGLLQATDININAEGNINNTKGRIISKSSTIIDAKDSIGNKEGIIAANEISVIKSKNFIDNQQGIISAKRSNINSSGLDNSQGTIEAEQLTVNIQGELINNSGIIRQLGSVDQTIQATKIVNGKATDNAGIIETNAKQFSIKADQLVNEGKITHAGTGLLDLAIGWLTNIKGAIQTNNQLNIKGQSINNSSGLISAKNTEINANQLENKTGLIEANGELVIDITGNLDNTEGVIRAVDKNSATKINTTGTFNNTKGIVEVSSSSLNIDANSINNTAGFVRNSGNGATSLAVEQTFNNTQGKLLSKGLLRIKANQLDNTNGTIYGTGGFSFDISGLNNTNGYIYNHNQSNLNFNFSRGNIVNDGGKILGDQDLIIDVASLENNGGLIQAKSWLSLMVDELESGGSSDIRGGSGISIDANNLTNNGLLTTDGDLDLLVRNQLVNFGTLSTLSTLKLNVGELINEVGSTLSAATIDEFKVSGDLYNKGRLSSAKAFTIDTINLYNSGTLGSGEELTLNIANRLVNNNDEAGSLIFSAGDMHIYANQLENRFATIFSNGKLTIAKNNTNEKNQSIVNSSGVIESLADIDIYTNSLTNKKDRFEFKEYPVSGTITYSCIDCKGRHFDLYYYVEEQLRADIINDSPSSQLVAGGDLSIYGGEIINQNSLISANKNIHIEGAKLVNQGAQVTTGTRYRTFRNPGDSERRGVFFGLVNNEIKNYNNSNSRHIIKYYHTTNRKDEGSQTHYYSPSRQKTGSHNPYYNPNYYVPVPGRILSYSLVSDNTTRTESHPVGKSTIEAGGNISVNVTQQISNTELKPHGALKNINRKYGATSATGRQLIDSDTQSINQPLLSTDTAEVRDQLAEVAKTIASNQNTLSTTANNNKLNQDKTTGSNFVAVNPLDTPGFRLPTGQYGLFVESNNPDHPFIIETNPLYADYATFISSSYLLSRLGYNEDKIIPRLGDGLYETQLIRQAVFAQTGRRFIANNVNSDYEQFKYLMDNAIESKQKLNLSLGISLSTEQVAALTHDIVWLEEETLNGKKVLVPVVYFGQSKKGELAPDGSLIVANDINLISGDDLENVGTIHAYNDLTIEAAKDTLNSGVIASNKKLTIETGKNVINKQAGQIIADDLSLTASDGSIINDRMVTERSGRWEGSHRYITTDVDQASVIHANSDLKLNAKNDILNKASVISSEGNAELVAGNNIELQSKQKRQRDAYYHRKSYEITDSTNQISAQINVQGNLAIAAGHDVHATASNISSGGNTSVKAGNDISLKSAANEEHYDYYRKKSKKKIWIERNKVRQQKSTLVSGGNLEVAANNNIQLAGSEVKATGDVQLAAANDLKVVATKDENFYLYQKKKKKSFGRKSAKRTENYQTANVASVVSAGGDLLVNVGKDTEGGLQVKSSQNVTAVGSQLSANKDVVIYANKDINIVSGQQESYFDKQKSKTGFGGFSGNSKKHEKTKLKQVASTVVAGNDAVVLSGRDINVVASEVNAKNDVALSSGLKESGNINLIADHNKATEFKEKQSHKLSLKLGDGMLSVASGKAKRTTNVDITNAPTKVIAERDVKAVAKQDLQVIGSTVKAGRNVELISGRDAVIKAGTELHQKETESEKSRKGIGFSSDGNGITLSLGEQTKINTVEDAAKLTAATTVTAGKNINVEAGRDIQQIASDLAANNNIDLKAKRNINIDAGHDEYSHKVTKRKVTDDVSITINHNYKNTEDAVSNIGEGDNLVSKASGVLKAIDAVDQFMSGPTAEARSGVAVETKSYEEIQRNARGSTLTAGNSISATADEQVQLKGAKLQSGQQITLNGKNVKLVAAESQLESGTTDRFFRTGGVARANRGGSAGGEVGLTEDKQTVISSQPAPTVLNSGNDINVNAENNIDSEGTQAIARNNINLVAGNELNIKSAVGGSEQKVEGKQGNIESGFGLDTSGKIGYYVSGSIGKNNLDRDNTSHVNSNLTAGNTFNSQSGSDTNVVGANVNADLVNMEVGNNLNVESPQDTGDAEGKRWDLSGQVSVGYGATVSVSGGFGETSGNKKWVEKQTSIIGNKSVNVEVQKNTDLKGAVIAAKNGNLTLETDTLTYSDVKDKEKETSYYASGSYSYSNGGNQSSSNDSNWAVEGYHSKLDREQINRATIGEGRVIVRKNFGQDLSTLNRDLTKAQEITKDDDSRTDVYVSSTSLEALENPVAKLKEWKTNLEFYDDRVAERTARLVKLANVIDNKVLGNQVSDQVVDQFANDVQDSIQAVQTSLSPSLDENGRIRFGLSASFTERLLALKSARTKAEDTRVIDQLVEILNNATDYKAHDVLAAVTAFTKLYGNEGVKTLLYGDKASKAKGYFSESQQLLGLNINQLDISDVNELINILSHENYHASSNGSTASEETLANIHADRFAFEWYEANTAEDRHTGGRKGITTEEWEANESNSDVIASGNHTTNSVNDQENALCGGLCIGLVVAIITYTTVEGEGDPVEGLREIGRRNDTITKVAGPIISEGINTLLDSLSQEHRDELLGALNYIAETSESALKGADNLTNNVTSEWWNGLAPETQDALKGLGVVVSIPTGVGAGTKVTVSLSEKTLDFAKQAKKLASKKDNKTNSNYSDHGDVDAETGHSNLAVNETGAYTSADNPGGRNPGDEFSGESDFNGSESHPVKNDDSRERSINNDEINLSQKVETFVSKLPDPESRRLAQVTLDLSEAGKIKGLNEWLEATRGKEQPNISDLISELKEAKRIINSESNVVVDLGNDFNAPLRKNGQKMATMDLTIEGPVIRNIEIKTIENPVRSARQMIVGLAHAAEKARSRIEDNLPIQGRIEGTALIELDTSSKRKRNTVTEMLHDGTMKTYSNGVERTSVNIFDSIPEILRKGKKDDFNLVDSFHIVDKTTGNLMASYNRIEKDWVRVK